MVWGLLYPGRDLGAHFTCHPFWYYICHVFMSALSFWWELHLSLIKLTYCGKGQGLAECWVSAYLWFLSLSTGGMYKTLFSDIILKSYKKWTLCSKPHLSWSGEIPAQWLSTLISLKKKTTLRELIKSYRYFSPHTKQLKLSNLGLSSF